MADIYDEEYVNRKLAEVIHCKTCGQLMTPELQNWRWYRLKNGDRVWRQYSSRCKTCLAKKSSERYHGEKQKLKREQAAAKRNEQRRKQAEERIERQKKESFICKTCGELTPPELHQWSKVNSCNGEKRWKRRAHCKPCLSQKSAEKQFKKRNASQEAREQFNARSREYKKKYYASPANRLKRNLREKDSGYFKAFCYYVYKTFKPLGLSDPKEDLVSMLKKEIQRRIKDESTPEIEIAAFYAAQGKPWANPRISPAEAFRIRYKIDKSFRDKEKVRSKIRKELEGRGDKAKVGVLRRNKRQKLQADNTLTAFRLGKLLKANKSCLYCGKHLKDTQKAFDHMDPIAKGGEHSITNLAISCKPCNNRKAAKDFFYWLQEIKSEHAEKALNYYESQKSQRVQAVLAYNIS